MLTSWKTGFGTLVAASLLAAVGCGGDTGGSSAGRGAVSGGVCSQNGAQTFAADGCNTCSCDAGVWACTTNQCSSACTKGATTFDGCNTCSCMNGQWACTEKACSVCTEGQTTNDGCNTCSCSGGKWTCTGQTCLQTCPAVVTPPPGTECNGMAVYAKDPQSGICCHLSGCSTAPPGWTTSAMPCDGSVCVEGENKRDGCNTCSCSGGRWMCTAMACMQDAGAGSKACGGWAGDTCTASEYCAYQAGALCGAADAESVCKPRPQVCDTLYAPVCGCDQKTYSNDCAAAAAGTGVYSTGPCTAPAP